MERQRYFSLMVLIMQQFYFSPWVSLILCFVLWPVFQILAAIIAQKLPAYFFQSSNFFFKPKHFERNGEIYNTLFKISHWKKYLPDGAAVLKSGYRKKHLSSFTTENMKRFLLESCRGELGHWLAITPFWVFGLFLPPGGLFFMLLYALIINLPCIFAQRYNRPRIIKILEKRQRK